VTPLVFPFVYRRLEAAATNPKPLMDFAMSVGCIYALGLLLRAWGRAGNSEYLEFAQTLQKAKKNYDREAKVSASMGKSCTLNQSTTFVLHKSLIVFFYCVTKEGSIKSTQNLRKYYL